MFDIYIKNFYRRDGTYVANEKLLYTIPMEPGEDNVLVDPKIQCDMGKAGSLEFSMNPGHPYYESFKQMKTIFRCVYDGTTLFRGRVLTIDTGHLSGVKKVHCEGDLAFFIDSQMEGITDDKRPSTDALTFLKKLINNHNTQMANDIADKKFVLGEVPGQYTSATAASQKVTTTASYKYGSSSWSDTQSVLSNLADEFGGYFRTRYQNGTTYLDWLNNYYETDIIDQPMELGENLIDINSSSEVNNIFTALIPVGSAKGKSLYIKGYKNDIHGNNKFILVPQLTKVFSDAQLNSGFHSKADYENAINDYGYIFKTENFSNADTQAKLWSYATDWMKNNYNGGLSSFSISALDMHVLQSELGKYVIGKRVHVIYPDINKRDTDPGAMIDKTMVIMSATYDLHHPDKNNYTVGIPNQILKKNYGYKAQNKKSSTRSAGKKKEDGNKDKGYDANKELTEQMLWAFVLDGAHNSEQYDKYRAKYGDKAESEVLQTAYMAIKKKLAGENYNVYTMVLDGHNAEFSIKGSGKENIDQHFIDESGDLVNSILINGDKRYISIAQAPPEGSENWTEEQVKKYTGEVVKIGANDTGDGGKLEIGKLLTDSDTGTTETQVTAAADGIKGLLAGSGIELGNGLEDINKVLDGDVTSMLSMKGAASEILGRDGNASEKFKLSGILGTGLFGKKADGTDENWLVFLNNTVSYKDKDGATVVSPGFVTAADFSDLENEIPSFKTKLAVVDTLIAGKASIGELNAVKAKIDTITANTITANTYVSASNGIFTTLRAGTIYVNGGTDAGGSAVSTNISNALIGADFSEGSGDLAGKMVLTLTKINGDTIKTNFKIADTTECKKLVSAAEISGWQQAGSAVTAALPSPQTSSNLMLIPYPSLQKDTLSYLSYGVACNNDYAYIYDANDKVVARVANSKPTGAITDVTLRPGANAVYNRDEKEYTVPLRVTGSNISNSPYDGKAVIVSGSDAYSHGHTDGVAESAGITSINLNGPSDTAYSDGTDKGTLTTSKYYQVEVTPKSGGKQYIKFQAPAPVSIYSSYRATFSWKSGSAKYGSTSSTRIIVAQLQGKNASGTWVNIGTSSYTVKATRKYDEEYYIEIT